MLGYRTLLEGAAFQEAKVHSDGVEIHLAVQGSSGGEQRAGAAGGAGTQFQVSAAADCADMVMHHSMLLLITLIMTAVDLQACSLHA